MKSNISKIIDIYYIIFTSRGGGNDWAVLNSPWRGVGGFRGAGGFCGVGGIH
jgi:hypothetical protein